MKRTLRTIVAFLAMLSVVSLAGASHITFLTQGSPQSFVRVMNVGTAPATMQVDYYHKTDTSLNQTHAVENVAVNVGAAFAPIVVPGFPSDWDGSAVAAADQEIAAASYIQWSGGSYNSDNTAYAGYSGISAPSSEFYVPLIARRGGPFPEHTAITVQNADTSEVTVDIHFYDRATGAEITSAQSTMTIQPNKQKTLNQSSMSDTQFPEDNTLAAAVVKAQDAKKIAVIATIYGSSDAESYEGIPSGSNNLYYARVLRLVNNDGTYREYSGIVAQNLSSTDAANVTVSWYDRDGNFMMSFDDVIPAFTSHGYNTRWQADIPDAAWADIDTTLGKDFLGSVKIESTNGVPIAGVNRNWNVGKNLQNAFIAQASGSTEVYFPYFYRQATNGTVNGGGTWRKETGIVLQNLDTTTAADVLIEIYNLDGNKVYEFRDTVAPNSSRGYNSRYMSYTNWTDSGAADTAIGYNQDGTVKVTSETGQPLIGVGFITVNGNQGAIEYSTYNK